MLQKFMRVPKSMDMDKEEWIKYNLELITAISPLR